jgi:dUTP pyrophosphatase
MTPFLKCRKIHEDAVLPKKAHAEDAGFDLVPVTIEAEGSFRIHSFGLAVHIPWGHVGLLFPRSSGWKTDQFLSNCVGVIDHGYIGEVKARFRAASDFFTQKVKTDGKATAQLVIVPIATVNVAQWQDQLPESTRGEKGWGSTTK